MRAYLAVGNISFFHQGGLVGTLVGDVAAGRNVVTKMKPSVNHIELYFDCHQNSGQIS